ncbi:MAG: ion channel [Jatrophihabitans sp.]|uniref:ion channel n=1 Tax=Jatrophihabitans sp. TaxID=1932789 RepID=UPI003F7EA733
MDLLLRLVGIVLLLAVAQDVFQTVLFPASGRGVLRKPLEALVWRLFRRAALWTRGRTQRSVLAYCGPAQIAVLLAVWFLLLDAGWALIYQPALGHGIRAGSGPTDTGWATAFYYSGFLITTLGTGDYVAATGLWRTLAIVDTASGFVTISMIITYFLNVYGNLTTRNAFALGVHHRTRQTDDAARFVAGLVADADLPDARGYVNDTASVLREVLQSHLSYPVLRYFHYRDTYYALPRMLLTLLDARSIIGAALDQGRYAGIVRSSALDELDQAADALLAELIPRPPVMAFDQADRDRWGVRFGNAVRVLRRSGIEVDGSDVALHRYVADRATWEPRLRHLARVTLYRWPDDPTPPDDDEGDVQL